MGWTFQRISKERLVAEIVAGSLDHAVRGNSVYHLREIGQGEHAGMRVICVDLLEAGDAGEYGNKGMDETAGPRVVDCPERLLAASTCTLGYAPEWREKCRAARRAKGESKKAATSWSAGDWLMWCGQVVTFNYLLPRGRAACTDATGRQYAYRVSELSLPLPARGGAAGDETAHYRCEA